MVCFLGWPQTPDSASGVIETIDGAPGSMCDLNFLVLMFKSEMDWTWGSALSVQPQIDSAASSSSLQEAHPGGLRR